MLHKELFVQPIAVVLQQMSMAYRARHIFNEEFKLIDTKSFPFKRSLASLSSHPFRASYAHARVLADNAGAADSETLREKHIVINAYIRKQANLLSTKLWSSYWGKRIESETSNRGLSGRPAALADDWGRENIKRHRGLSRAQSTVLIQCRTDFIGLDSFLYPRKLAETDMCSCGFAKHTVEHLFYECPLLSKERRNLPLKAYVITKGKQQGRWENVNVEQMRMWKNLTFRETPVTGKGANKFGIREVSIETLLSKHPDVTSTWAIHHFGLSQFEWTDQHMIYGPSKKHPHLLFEGT
ncbi:hypothetical protein CORC01_11804 [Colletotrichum orchidophilum]|uniref:Zinc knuckle n=1 Tax=Colletotrichum orchidophilum TaxID=1209926 RepID=A0A1G4AUU3_9PEZI|nr:uncharacterized protein CORC01_11804 [Colletotrichum orchidophilum]OHE92937.1 hypothetical protein CORC01_11804 [Colletotrichum orchidophilum]